MLGENSLMINGQTLSFSRKLNSGCWKKETQTNFNKKNVHHKCQSAFDNDMWTPKLLTQLLIDRILHSHQIIEERKRLKLSQSQSNSLSHNQLTWTNLSVRRNVVLFYQMFNDCIKPNGWLSLWLQCSHVTTQILGSNVTSRKQGLSPNDKGRQWKESLETRLGKIKKHAC